jgi:hypothetical protein
MWSGDVGYILKQKVVRSTGLLELKFLKSCPEILVNFVRVTTIDNYPSPLIWGNG